MPKAELAKASIRFYSEDLDLIRETFPGGFGNPGLNQVVREVIHSWCELKLRNKEEDNKLNEIDVEASVQAL